MPATGRKLLVELRAAGFTVTIGPDKLRVVDPPGKVAMWRPTFDVEPSGRLTDAQRDDLKKNRISVCRASRWSSSSRGPGIQPMGPTLTGCSSDGRNSAPSWLTPARAPRQSRARPGVPPSPKEVEP
jgi:hypothetical protein